MSDSEKKPLSIAAVLGLVAAIVALLTSWVPIVNNASFVIALVGAALCLLGLVAAVRGRRSGRIVAVAGLVFSILSCAFVLSTQSAYSDAMDAAVEGPQVASTSSDQVPASTDGDQGGDGSASKPLVLGTAAQLENGLSVTVDSVQAGLVNYDGSPVVGIHVTYVNGGDESVDYNAFDWKGRDAQGAAEAAVYYSEAAEELTSGELAPGGTVSGNLYFAGDVAQALYYSSALADEPTAVWALA